MLSPQFPLPMSGRSLPWQMWYVLQKTLDVTVTRNPKRTMSAGDVAVAKSTPMTPTSTRDATTPPDDGAFLPAADRAEPRECFRTALTRESSIALVTYLESRHMARPWGFIDRTPHRIDKV